MDEHGKGREREDGIDETSLIEDDNEDPELDDPVSGPSGRVTRIEDGVPNVGRDVGVMRGSITNDKKQIFRVTLGAMISKKDGEASKDLIELTEFSFDKKGRVNGASFDGVKVLVYGIIRYSENKSKKVVEHVELFKKRLDEARTEHSNTTEGTVEEINDPTISEEVMADINNLTSQLSDQ